MKLYAMFFTSAAALMMMMSHGEAAFSCKGPLTPSQVEGFKTYFDPDFSPALKHIGGAVTPENMSKAVTQAELAMLEVSQPIVAASASLDDTGANTLKAWLNANADAAVPGWFSTTLGIVAPAAWLGVAADVAVQLINGNGDAGRIKLANIAGTVSEGGHVGVVHRIAKDANGKRFYLWNYVYTAELNAKKITFLVASCSADVKTQ